MTDLPPGLRPYAAYVRDSGGEGQELSVPQQKTALQAWAGQNGCLITHWFSDEARPGSTIVGRDGFQALIAHFRRGCPQEGVIIWKFSRFARDIDDSQFYKADLRRRGYKVISINDNIPEGPEGRFFEAAIDWMNQRFLDDLSDDVKRGLRHLVETYGAVPGTPPRGFKRQPVELPRRRDGRPHLAHRWVPDPEITPLIRTAFELRARHVPLAAINAQTHLFGSLNSYKTFFTNKLYLGILEYGDLVIENYCDPIVDLPTWNAVQAVIRQYAARANLKPGNPHQPRRQGSRYLLSGLAFCAKCGSPLYGASAPQRSGKICDRYACTRAARRRDCPQKAIPRKVLETAVLETLRDFILTPENLLTRQAQVHQSQQTRQADIERQRADLKTRLNGVRRRIANITDTLADAGPSRPLTDKLARLETEENTLLATLAKLNTSAARPLPNYTPDQIAAKVAHLKEKLMSKDLAEVQRVLRGITNKIVVERDGTKIYGLITYYYPPNDTTDDDDPNKSLPEDDIVHPSSPPKLRHHPNPAWGHLSKDTVFCQSFTTHLRSYQHRKALA